MSFYSIYLLILLRTLFFGMEMNAPASGSYVSGAVNQDLVRYMDRGPLEAQPGFPPHKRPREESRPREAKEASQALKG